MHVENFVYQLSCLSIKVYCQDIYSEKLKEAESLMTLMLADLGNNMNNFITRHIVYSRQRKWYYNFTLMRFFQDSVFLQQKFKDIVFTLIPLKIPHKCCASSIFDLKCSTFDKKVKRA